MSRKNAASEAAGRIADLYGEGLEAACGVIHVASVWRAPDGSFESLAINQHTPPGETDAFVLAVARARADAIVTTGKILRSEPRLSHALPGGEGGALACWRREILGRLRPPELFVLTRGESLDSEHPALACGAHLVTGPRFAAALRRVAACSRTGLEVVEQEHPSLRALIEMQTFDEERNVVVEAGASSARALYQAPCLVEELMLSIYIAPRIPLQARAGPFVSEAEIEAAGLELVSERAPELDGGSWLFRRYRGRPSAPRPDR